MPASTLPPSTAGQQVTHAKVCAIVGSRQRCTPSDSGPHTKPMHHRGEHPLASAPDCQLTWGRTSASSSMPMADVQEGDMDGERPMDGVG
jgi:hypothetical protein